MHRCQYYAHRLDAGCGGRYQWFSGVLYGGWAPYLYIGTSLHWSPSKRLRLGDCPVFKLDAITGEYIWIRSYFCNTIAGISGGVQATPVLGKHEIEDLIIFPIARTPSVRNGIVVALDKKTGKEVWRYKMKAYAWSSPVAVYEAEGKAYLLQGDSAGTLHLLDARTGNAAGSASVGCKYRGQPGGGGEYTGCRNPRHENFWY